MTFQCCNGLSNMFICLYIFDQSSIISNLLNSCHLITKFNVELHESNSMDLGNTIICLYTFVQSNINSNLLKSFPSK